MSFQSNPSTNFQIPTFHIDTLGTTEGNIQALREACETVGFFYINVVSRKNDHPRPPKGGGNHDSSPPPTTTYTSTTITSNNSNSNNNNIIPKGITEELFQRILQHAQEFFALPTEAKKKLYDPLLNRGYTAMGEQTLDPMNQTQGDTKEGYYIGRDIPKDSPNYDPDKLAGSNIWPKFTSKSTNSHDQLDEQKWKESMTQYHTLASAISFRLVQCLALAIGLDNEHYFDEKFDNPIATLRLLRYATTIPSCPEQGIYACGAHSDFGILTLLFTNHVPGLQIQMKKETLERIYLSNQDSKHDNGDLEQEHEQKHEPLSYFDEAKKKNPDHKQSQPQQPQPKLIWVDIPPPPLGTLIVNLGDMLERWTNGKFVSTVHRVLTCGTSERYSVPFFYEPNFDTVVTCLDVCCGEDNPPKYPPVTVGNYLLDKFQQSHKDFGLEEEEED